MTEKLVLRMPDDWHAHLREMELLIAVACLFDIYGRVLCMGNTLDLIKTATEAQRYKDEILRQNISFEPVVCIMLTRYTTVAMINEAARAGIKFVKFMPDGATTGAKTGFRLNDYKLLYELFEAIIKNGMFLLVHAELNIDSDGNEVPYIDRERRSIDLIAPWLIMYPELKLTIEHVSTLDMMAFVCAQPADINIGATVTPQHAWLTYDMVFGDAPWPPKYPFNFCLPVAKLKEDRQAVIKVMTSGNPRFYWGSDTAPHPRHKKEGDLIAAGVTFGSSSFCWGLEIFHQANAMDKAENFFSLYGAIRYGFPLNRGAVTVERKIWQTPLEESGVRNCLGGEELNWMVTGVDR